MIPFCPGTPNGPVPGHGGTVVTDDRLLLRVATCLLAVLGMRGYGIAVRVQNGVVMLDGFVDSEEFRLLAHRLAWSVPSVRDVCDQLVLDKNA